MNYEYYLQINGIIGMYDVTCLHFNYSYTSTNKGDYFPPHFIILAYSYT